MSVAPAWQTALMAMVFLGPFLSGNIATNAHWMVAFITALAAFLLTLTLAWRTLAASRSATERASIGVA
jgi:ABC-type Fe3+-siderophore transport system permease subunit